LFDSFGIPILQPLKQTYIFF